MIAIIEKRIVLQKRPHNTRIIRSCNVSISKPPLIRLRLHFHANFAQELYRNQCWINWINPASRGGSSSKGLCWKFLVNSSKNIQIRWKREILVPLLPFSKEWGNRDVTRAFAWRIPLWKIGVDEAVYASKSWTF